MEIKLESKKGEYAIYIEKGILNSAGGYAKRLNPKKVFVVTDSNVEPLYFEKLKNSLEKRELHVSHAVIEAGEVSKSIECLTSLYKECIKASITRSDLIIALGGGVVGDVTGFLASTYLRGLKLIQIPTTLLSQIDSSVGGKTAVNLPEGKNLVGTFYQPDAVLIDPETLSTLPDREYSAGLSEAIKYAVIRDRKMLDYMKDFKTSKRNIEKIIERCVKIKRDVVEKDEFDKGERMILNYGHTVGHAIEKAGGYLEYIHGEAVAIGMICAMEISEKLKYSKPSDRNKLKEIILANNLPVSVPYDPKECLKAISNDKKMDGDELNVILPKGLGDCEIVRTTPNAFLSLAYDSSVFAKKAYPKNEE